MKIIKINPKRPEPAIIQEAAANIRQGNLVIFPTETVYGLAANALDGAAVKKIFQAKGRPEHKPIPVLIARQSDLKAIAQSPPLIARKIMNRLWPGPLTLVFKKKLSVPKEISAGSRTVAVRISAHPVAAALVRAAGVPITATSANFSGQPAHQNPKTLIKEFGRANQKYIALFLDAGPTPIGQPSTVLDVTKKTPAIIRAGAVPQKRIQKILGC